MALVNVRDRLGVKFRVRGVFLFDIGLEETPAHERQYEGSFEMTVNALSASQAMKYVADKMTQDIVVHSVVLA